MTCRILSMLEEDGWLEKTPSTQTYVTNVNSLNDQPDGYTEGLGAAGKLYTVMMQKTHIQNYIVIIL